MNTIVLTRRLCTQYPLARGLFGAAKTKGVSIYLVPQRTFWKLKKETLSTPPPDTPPSTDTQPTIPKDTETPKETQLETKKEEIQKELQTPAPQTTPTPKHLHNNKKKNKSQQHVSTTPVSSPPLSPLRNLPPDGIIFQHDQKWFFRLFGAGVGAQFCAWIIFLGMTLFEIKYISY